MLRQHIRGRRKGVQLVEFGGHVVHLGQLMFLLRDVPDVSVHYRAIASKYVVEYFNQAGKSVKFFVASPAYFPGYNTLKFYFHLTLNALSSRYIWVSTGPEHRAFPDVVVLALLVILRPDDVILNIRNLDAWAVSRKMPQGLTDKWRKFVFARVAKLTFERRAQMVEYERVSVPLQRRSSVVPTRFSDSFATGEDFALSTKKTWATFVKRPAFLRLGLLGAIDPRRRDYSLVLRAIGGLEPHLLAKVEVVILGGVVGFEAVSLVQRISNVCSVVGAQEGFLSEEEFAYLGQSCDLLISPLQHDMGYEGGKGSGAFGDAIFLRKPLLVPSWVALDGEYDEFCFYYSDFQSLAELVGAYVSGSVSELEPAVWEKYKTKHVLRGMTSDLGLEI